MKKLTEEERKAWKSAYNKAYRETHKEEMKAKKRASYKANKERIAAQRRAYREANRNRSLLSGAQRRAMEVGFEFDIALEDIVIPEFCPVLGIRLDPRAPPRSDALPSIDRVDSSRGYIKGNVRVISWRANVLKRDMSIGEVAALYEYMLDHMCGNKP